MFGQPPCDWPVTYPTCDPPLPAPPPGSMDEFEAVAKEYLWRWTGRVVGECDVQVRPCRKDCNGPRIWPHYYPYTPTLVGRQWLNLGCGCGEHSCSCGSLAELILPGPISSVTGVLIDGVALDPTDYTVFDQKRIVRTDGGTWPSCQDMAKPVTGPDTFQISYRRGIPVPTGGQLAAGVLATEIQKAACRDSTCALPQRVQSVVRQGVGMSLPPSEAVIAGHTGIWLVDSWVDSMMKAPSSGGRVYSPDLHARSWRSI